MMYCFLMYFFIFISVVTVTKYALCIAIIQWNDKKRTVALLKRT